MEYGIMSLVPTIVAVGMALITQNVYASLLLGLFLGNVIISGYHIFAGVDGTINSITGVFASGGNVTTMLAITLLGGMIYMIQTAGGVNGFVELLTTRTTLVKSKKSANLFTWLIGIIVFVSASMSSLIAGSITKPLNDKYLTSHEKQAYIVHSVGVPVCVLIPLSSWGAYMISVLEGAGVENAAGVLVRSIPCSIYVLLAVFTVPVMILTGFDFGPIKKAELRAAQQGLLDAPGKGVKAESGDAITDKVSSVTILGVPVLLMIAVTVWGMYTTGDGNILNGAGMKSFLWGVLAGIAAGFIMITGKKILTPKEVSAALYKGWINMIPIVIILTFALGVGDIVATLGTGEYLAHVFSGLLNPALLPMIVFVISMIIAFSTGSSWGTMAVIIPLSMPIAFAMDVNIALLAGAIWSGGIFGDQCSPISDSTIVSCAATGCDVIDHIRSQLPYTLTMAAISAAAFILLGFVM
ncbi:Na+/H+ antiporter NhaC family protein [Bacilliculturomica massiliensis]|uniref:Na+/H+ antiporter NhaC family protein n=1 Tax=Bacilliculturomica massiliensis TaxID=1917867 RepID=UPI0010312E7B|nr:Na+/H+ antiporter NhaC family protein [Bacilliculturomica massiliensis]